MRITLPISTIQTGGALEAFNYDLLVSRSDLVRTLTEDTVTIAGTLEMTAFEVYIVVTNGGEVYENLMAVVANTDLLGLDLIEGLPNRLTLSETAQPEIRKFKNWFETGSTAYLKNDESQILFLSNPVGNSASEYLTGTQLVDLTQISGYGVGVYSVEQFEDMIATGDWDLIDLN